MTYCLPHTTFILFGCIFLFTQVQSQCQQLTLTTSKSYKRLSGVYIIHCLKNDGMLIYKHKLQGLFLYQNGSGVWYLGPVVGGEVVYLRVADGASSPDKVKKVWQAWSETQQTWVNDAARFQCSDCQTIIFNGTGIPDGIKGKYLSQNIIHNLRPIYKHQSNTLYMHYTSCHKWIVGPKVGQNMGAMFTVSNATTPGEVSESWTVFTVTSELETDAVQAKCLDDNRHVFKPNPRSWKGCGMNSLDSDAPVDYLLMGTEVRQGKYPWMVSIRRPDGVHRCGGVLIGSRWVLTAGHCTRGTGPSSDTALLGAYNLDLAQEPERQSYKIKQAYRHPNFTWIHSPFEVDKDVGLLELEEDVTYNNNVQPVCLPDSPAMDFIDTADECYLAGWGQIDTRSDVGGVLRELKGRVIDAQTCGRTILTMLEHWLPYTSSLCILPKNYGKICTGDSGGPLLCSRSGRWYTLGIASWVIVACISTNLPSVYMDITQDLDWIRSTCDC